MAAEHAAIGVQFIDDYVLEAFEKLHPFRVVREHGGVEHVRVREHDMPGLAHGAASVGWRVSVVCERANFGVEVRDEPVKLIELPPTATNWYSWTPDGKAVEYAAAEGGVGNIWRQPIDGSARTKVTNFSDDKIFFFAWNKEHTIVASARGSGETDVVLITGYR